MIKYNDLKNLGFKPLVTAYWDYKKDTNLNVTKQKFKEE